MVRTHVPGNADDCPKMSLKTGTPEFNIYFVLVYILLNNVFKFKPLNTPVTLFSLFYNLGVYIRTKNKPLIVSKNCMVFSEIVWFRLNILWFNITLVILITSGRFLNPTMATLFLKVTRASLVSPSRDYKVAMVSLKNQE